jgi:hypothetical protein
VIYFYFGQEVPLYLITVYAKAAREDLSAEEKKVFSHYVNELKRAFRN